MVKEGLAVAVLSVFLVGEQVVLEFRVCVLLLLILVSSEVRSPVHLSLNTGRGYRSRTSVRLTRRGATRTDASVCVETYGTSPRPRGWALLHPRTPSGTTFRL